MTYALAAAFPEPLSGAAGRGVGPVYFRVRQYALESGL